MQSFRKLLVLMLVVALCGACERNKFKLAEVSEDANSAPVEYDHAVDRDVPQRGF